MVHDIDVLWWFCAYEGCEHKAKTNNSITLHKANKHNIGVKWKQCADCDYKAKHTGDLNKHIKKHHS